MKILLASTEAEIWLKILFGSPFLWICYIVLGLSIWGLWNSRREKNKRVPLWTKLGSGYDSKGQYEERWLNGATGLIEYVNYDASNDPKFQEMISERKLNKFIQERNSQQADRIQRSTIYFEVDKYPRALIKIIVPELLTNPNPQVPLWKSGIVFKEDSDDYIYGDRRWYNLRGEYKFKEYLESIGKTYLSERVKNEPIKMDTYNALYTGLGMLDFDATIPLSEVVYPRVSADQVIHRSPYDKDFHKYGPDGSKAPSNIWTVFPAMTAIFLIFGLIALPMEGGIPFGIGLFVLWCVGMYKNAKHKSYWDGQRKKEERNRIERISRSQRGE